MRVNRAGAVWATGVAALVTGTTAPVFAEHAPAPLRLRTVVSAEAVSSGISDYAVTVQTVRRAAHGVRLSLTADVPVVWVGYPAECAPGFSETLLVCGMGELTGARTLRVTAMPADPSGAVITMAASATANPPRPAGRAGRAKKTARSEKGRRRVADQGARMSDTQGQPPPMPMGGPLVPPQPGTSMNGAPLGPELPSRGSGGTPPLVAAPPMAAVPPVGGTRSVAGGAPAYEPEGTSKLTTFPSPRVVAEQRRSWATLAAIAAAAAAGLLWLATWMTTRRRSLR